MYILVFNLDLDMSVDLQKLNCNAQRIQNVTVLRFDRNSRNS